MTRATRLARTDSSQQRSTEGTNESGANGVIGRLSGLEGTSSGAILMIGCFVITCRGKPLSVIPSVGACYNMRIPLIGCLLQGEKASPGAIASI